MIRPMTIDDVAEVALIERECFSEPWSQDGFLSALESSDNIFIVSEEDGNIIGYVGLYGSFDEGEITNVAVTDKARGKGTGYQLMCQMEKLCIDRNIEKIFLEVRVSNEKAIGLYNKCGFEKCGIRKRFYRNPTEDGLVMVKECNIIC